MNEELSFSQIRVPEDIELQDISTEEFRIYQFSTEDSVKIENPVALHISRSGSGGHYIFDRWGQVHYIPAAWMRLTWKNKDGCKYHMDF